MKLAIIGSYGHTNLTLDHLPHAPGVQLVAAGRYGPQDQLPFLARHEAAAGVAVYDDYRTMLDEARPDVVSVYTPMGSLAQASMEAVRRGCHVFSEKPLATSLEELDALRAAADRAGVQVTAMLEYRCHSAFMAVHDAVAAGRIGEPLLVTSQKSYPFGRRDETYLHRRTYGGTIPFIGIHAVDWIAYTTGKRFTRVAAMHGNGAHPERPGMEDMAGMLLELAGGGQAMVNMDYLRPWGRHELPWGDDRLRIAGSEAVVETFDHGRVARLLTGGGYENLPLPPERSLFGSFIASLRGQGPCHVRPEDAFYATRVCLLARQAADEGRIVEIEP